MQKCNQNNCITTIDLFAKILTINMEYYHIIIIDIFIRKNDFIIENE